MPRTRSKKSFKSDNPIRILVVVPAMLLLVACAGTPLDTGLDTPDDAFLKGSLAVEQIVKEAAEQRDAGRIPPDIDRRIIAPALRVLRTSIVEASEILKGDTPEAVFPVMEAVDGGLAVVSAILAELGDSS
jgi:hypothetical protein